MVTAAAASPGRCPRARSADRPAGIRPVLRGLERPRPARAPWGEAHEPIEPRDESYATGATRRDLRDGSDGQVIRDVAGDAHLRDIETGQFDLGTGSQCRETIE